MDYSTAPSEEGETAPIAAAEESPPPLPSVSEEPPPEKEEAEAPVPPSPEPLKRVRKRRVTKESVATDAVQPPYIEVPEMNANFWGSLLATQRAMEKQARREKLSNFSIA